MKTIKKLNRVSIAIVALAIVLALLSPIFIFKLIVIPLYLGILGLNISQEVGWMHERKADKFFRLHHRGFNDSSGS